MTRRGTILLEVTLALAIVVASGLALGGVLRESSAAMDRARAAAQADDLARSAMSLLELGLARPTAFTGPTDGDLLGADPSTISDTPTTPRWSIAVEIDPTDFAGLTLVTIRVNDARTERTLAALRQLVDLSTRGRTP